MHFLISSIDLAPLQKEFTGVKFTYFESDNDGFMRCISASFESCEDAIKLWSDVQSMAVANIKPSGDFTKWNLYFAIICVGNLAIPTKYIIQNDKFAMRKVIFDGYETLPDEAEIQCALNKAILGTDLEVAELLTVQAKGPDFSLFDIINGLPLDMTIASKEIRQNTITELIDNHLLK